MPAWLLGLLVNLVVKFGMPYVLTWLRRRFPGLPGEAVAPVLAELADNLKEHRRRKRLLVRQAKERMRECVGLNCVPRETGDRDA